MNKFFLFFIVLITSCTNLPLIEKTSYCSFPAHKPFPGGMVNYRFMDSDIDLEKKLIAEGLKYEVCRDNSSSINLLIPIPLSFEKEQLKISLSDESFGREYNEPLVHQTVVTFLAGARQGTVKQKTRSEVRGGGRKPWRQKGTGRARAGTIRSPIWRSGGVTFAARPQDHTKKLNKKMYRGAMQCILSELIRQNRLVVVSEFSTETHKTKDLVKKLKDFDLNNVLIVTDQVEENLFLASRNLHKVDVLDVLGLDPVSLIGFEKVLMTVSALKKVEEMLS